MIAARLMVGWLTGWFYGMSTFIGLFNAEVSLIFTDIYIVSNNYSYLTIIIICLHSYMVSSIPI